MALLDNEIQELQQKAISTTNLRKSIISIGLLIAASLIYFFGIDSFYSGHNIWTVWILLFLFYGLTVLATILAILALKKGIKLMKTSKDTKNYLSVGLSILALIMVVSEIIQRLLISPPKNEPN